MESTEVLLKFFGGSVLLIGLGWLVGHLLKLDKCSDDLQKSKEFHLKKTDVVIQESGD